MPQPVFDENDRVQDQLPPELAGKSPEEVMKYFLGREKTILTNATEQVRLAREGKPATPPAAPPVPQRVEITTPPAAPGINMTDGAKRTAIAGARQMMLNNLDAGTRDIVMKYIGEVDTLMNNMSEDKRMDLEQWVTAYQYVLGTHTAEIAKAAEDKGRAPIVQEGGDTPPENNTPPKPLAVGENKVVNGLGLTADRYREAQKQISEGAWPMHLNDKDKKGGK